MAKPEAAPHLQAPLALTGEEEVRSLSAPIKAKTPQGRDLARTAAAFVGVDSVVAEIGAPDGMLRVADQAARGVDQNLVCCGVGSEKGQRDGAEAHGAVPFVCGFGQYVSAIGSCE